VVDRTSSVTTRLSGMRSAMSPVSRMGVNHGNKSVQTQIRSTHLASSLFSRRKYQWLYLDQKSRQVGDLYSVPRRRAELETTSSTPPGRWYPCQPLRYSEHLCMVPAGSISHGELLHESNRRFIYQETCVRLPSHNHLPSASHMHLITWTVVIWWCVQASLSGFSGLMRASSGGYRRTDVDAGTRS
jgi:hypothetical protein